MSECKCGAFQKFQGSGCRYCNPQDTIEQLQQQNVELKGTRKHLRLGLLKIHGITNQQAVRDEIHRALTDNSRREG